MGKKIEKKSGLGIVILLGWHFEAQDFLNTKKDPLKYSGVRV